MHKPWSLRTRLVVGILVLLALASTAVGAISAVALERTLTARLDDQVGMALRFLAGPRLGAPSERRVGTLTFVVGGSTIVRADYVAEDGTAVALSALQQDALAALEFESTALQTVDLGGELGSFRVAEGTNQSVRIIAGLSTKDVSATITSLSWIYAAVALGVLGIAAAMGTVLVRRALAPLARVASIATRVSERPLAEGKVFLPERVPEADTSARTEVGQVGASLNRLLGHVEASLEARHASEEMLKRFIADASHELRTPLASIRGYAELSSRDTGPMSSTVRRSVQRIGSESLRMTSLIEDLLLLARLDAGQQLRHETVDLTVLMAEAVSDAHAADPNHQWVLELPDHATHVLGDPNGLRQVVVNVLANARIHTDQGSRIAVSVIAQSGVAIIRISDNGPGIPPGLQAQVFDRFARGDRARARATGSTGLGLSIAHAIVAAHRGSLNMHSIPGNTVFTITFPLRSSDRVVEPG